MRAKVLLFPRSENRCRLRSSDLSFSVIVHMLELGVRLTCDGTGSTDKLTLDEEALLLLLANLEFGELEAGELADDDDDDDDDNEGVLGLADCLLVLEPEGGV